MKSALVRKPIVPVPEPHSAPPKGPGTIERPVVMLQRGTTALCTSQAPRKGTTLSRAVNIVATWLVPGDLVDEMPPAVDAREIEALERHIRRFNEKHRFTGFPC